MARILTVFGTRPEAVKMGPVIDALVADGSFEVIVLATAQHREMLDDVLHVFELKPDYDLNVMTDNQKLSDVTAKCVLGIEGVIRKEHPALTIAQGDTTTVLASALASYYNRVPFAHVEAGLRTEDKFAPFPEEMNRRLTGALADLHFAPTTRARENLIREGVPPSTVHVCGNTVVDAVQRIAAREGPPPGLPEGIETFLANFSKLVLVTVHRRESFGAPMESICQALREIVDSNPEVGLLLPVHPNPNVRRTVRAILAGHPRIRLCDPLDYLQFVYLMKRAYLILSDSGGVQEEAPSLGKPVLVLREKTERPEGIQAGVARLVGTDRRRIVEEAKTLLTSQEAYRKMIGSRNPYGDGHASEKIVGIVREFLGVGR